MVKEQPGSPVSELTRALGLDRKTVEYHLRKLANDGLIAEVRASARRHVFPTGEGPARDERMAVAMLQNELRRSVLNEMADDPCATASDIARRLNVSRATVVWHIDRLAAAGLTGDLGANG